MRDKITNLTPKTNPKTRFLNEAGFLIFPSPLNNSLSG
ncbi:hypothetical protein M595_4408 [Lyngbya aestuarii BL J]|uniref:Uncharacterized protein n=1 Tax=Lyngbya aestuarii BL J TaxID=1348334 RepID=U7QCT6_9CYAN|nr:hypothetical protein M595_4408 [Lyngbya aestuarii BL J]